METLRVSGSSVVDPGFGHFVAEDCILVNQRNETNVGAHVPSTPLHLDPQMNVVLSLLGATPASLFLKCKAVDMEIC